MRCSKLEIFPKAEVRQYLLLISVAFFAGICIIYTSLPQLHLLSVWAVVFTAIVIVRADIMHPYTWFSFFFAIYNTSNTILISFGIDTTAGYSWETSFYGLIALTVVLLIVGPQKVTDVFPKKIIKVRQTPTLVWFIGLALLTIALALVLKSRGYSGKTEMQKAQDMAYRWGVRVVRWMMYFMLILMFGYIRKDRKKAMLVIATSALAATLMSAFTGERDIIFRYIVLMGIVFYYFGIIKKRHLLLLVPIGFAIMVASVVFKYVLAGGEMNTSILTSGNIIEMIISTEFGAAGKNMQWLINYSDRTNGYFGISLILTEILKVVIPFGTWPSPTSWYQNEIYPGKYNHVAFTLLGTGYVAQGLLGIVALFVIVGLLVRWFYKRSCMNLYTMVSYFYSITILMASFRSTLSVLLEGMIKGMLFALIMHKYLCQKLSISA